MIKVQLARQVDAQGDARAAALAEPWQYKEAPDVPGGSLAGRFPDPRW